MLSVAEWLVPGAVPGRRGPGQARPPPPAHRAHERRRRPHCLQHPEGQISEEYYEIKYYRQLNIDYYDKI